MKLPHALCSQCTLYPSPVAVPGIVCEGADVVFVGEAPGAMEEEQQVPFVGQSGALLDAAVAQRGGVTLGNYHRTNIVACRLPGNREPTDHEIACCAPRLKAELERMGASKIVALGKTAQQFFGLPENQRGAVVERNGKEVMGVLHPAYVLRDPDSAAEFLEQIGRAVSDNFKTVLPVPEVIFIETVDQLKDQLSRCPDNAWVAFDIETDQVNWYATPYRNADPILMLQLCWFPTFGIVLSDEMLYDTPGVVDVLQSFFSRVRTVGHNAKFDVVFLQHQLGLKIHQDFDTMLAHYTLNENLPHGLKFIARHMYGMLDYEEQLIGQYLASRNDRYSKIPYEELAKYGVWDVAVTLRLREDFESMLRKQGLYEKPFQLLLMPAANNLAQVELKGFRIDVEQLDSLSEEFANQIQDLTQKIRDAVDQPTLNPASTKQLSEVLYGRLGLPQVKGRKIKPGSTGKEALDKLQNAHPVIPLIQTFRKVSKMRSAYVENLRYYADRFGYVHPDFRITGTEVSRLSVADPALQTIPRPGERDPLTGVYYGRLIRSSFIASPGNVIMVVDYSQAELRVFACISGEEFLQGVYRDGRDLHSEVAIGMHGPGYTKEQRVQCKMFNFSYLYGGTEYSFAQDAGLNLEVARQFVKNYNRLMPRGLEFKQEQLMRARTDGFVTTRFGRVRRFPLITSSNLDDVRKACVHMPCASSASDLTLLSGNKLISMGVPVVLLVHDSVIIDCPANEADDIGALAQKTMQETASEWFPEVPWQADVEVGTRWAERQNP